MKQLLIVIAGVVLGITAVDWSIGSTSTIGDLVWQLISRI
jgi:hypothetical protein